MVLPYIDMNPPWVYMSSQSWIPLPPPSPYHLSGSSEGTSPKHPVKPSFFKKELVRVYLDTTDKKICKTQFFTWAKDLHQHFTKENIRRESITWKDASRYYSLEKYKWKLQWSTILHPPDCKYVFTTPSSVEDVEKWNFSWPIDRSINLNSFFSRQFGLYLVGLNTYTPPGPSIPLLEWENFEHVHKENNVYKNVRYNIS